MNIFDSKAKVLVNPVNVEGVAGAGLARQFKEKFPENFQLYRNACLEYRLTVGKIYWYSIDLTLLGQQWIANFPTKCRWRHKSKLEFIEDGLLALRNGMIDKRLDSVAMPKIGCGLGGLDWDDVKPMIEAAFEGTWIRVEYT